MDSNIVKRKCARFFGVGIAGKLYFRSPPSGLGPPQLCRMVLVRPEEWLSGPRVEDE